VLCVDWSCDNKLLKSNCGAYELLYWDVSLGKQILSSLDTIEADALWQTKTCVLGFEVGCLNFKIVSSNKLTTPVIVSIFQVMGIWPPESDGTDVNCVDVSSGEEIVSVAQPYFGSCIYVAWCCGRSRAVTTLDTSISTISPVWPRMLPASECQATAHM
jgi:hypothetical protein